MSDGDPYERRATLNEAGERVCDFISGHLGDFVKIAEEGWWVTFQCTACGHTWDVPKFFII